MTKLLIGLGLMILFGALFSVLSALRAKLFPEQASEEASPVEEVEMESREKERNILRAVVHCTGGGGAFSQYQYRGIRDCLAAAQLPGGGPLCCEYGCLGMGTCEAVCPSGAIQIREGVAVVDGERCTACGKCVDACPRRIISLEPYRPKRHVSIPCASEAAETTVTQVCADGCVGCSICVEACPREAITVEEGLARIDYEKCDHCGRCASNCPRHLIRAEKVAPLPEPEPSKLPRQPKPKKERPPKETKPRKEKPPKEPKPKKGKVELPLKELIPKKEKPPRKPEGEEEEKEKRNLPRLKLERRLREEPVREKLNRGEDRPGMTSVESPKAPQPSAPPVPVAVGSEGEKKDGPKTSAEAFEAFAQVVAAAGEALRETAPEGAEPPKGEESAVPATEEVTASGEKSE